MFRNRAHRLHFVGIGGIGMSGIAEVLLSLGYDVRGSDRAQNANTQRLRAMGVSIAEGHAAAHVGDADVVVTSSAVDGSNPEVMEARRRQIPVIRRAEMLAELMRLKYGIAVAGTHGKTTTTSLIAAILTNAEMDPTVIIGGRLKSLGSNARLGEGEYLVAEADESDGSFLRLVPTVAVVTNIEAEHLDHWHGGLPALTQAFLDFVNKVPFYGASVLCLDHPVVQSLLPQLDKRHVTYGFAPQADYVASHVEMTETTTQFDVTCRQQPRGRVTVGLIGRHNVQNALAALAVAEEVGVPFATAAQALAQFDGVGRRFEVKGKVAGIIVADDYGHHPTEIEATLRAAREAYPAHRIVVAFQPHRYTRTRDFLPRFARAFNDCHVLRVGETYAAGEDAIEGADGQTLAEQIIGCGHRDCAYAGDIDAMTAALLSVVRAGDLVLTFGAGSIFQVADRVIESLQRTSLDPAG